MTGATVFSPRRVLALVYRYWALLRRDPTRLIELVYWPTVQMILWGFITRFYVTQSDWLAQAAGMLIAAVLLWDLLFRSQLGVSLMFMEEMYARNLGHLFISPLRPYELVMALVSVSVIRTAIGFVGASTLALPLYHFNVYGLGLPLLVLFINVLAFGWALGLCLCSILLRLGLGAESLVWVSVFALAPLSGIYYPISTLPPWLQDVAWFLPTSHVFEGMRALMIEGVFRADLLGIAMALNGAYLALGVAVFLFTFSVARQRGLLLNIGE